MLAQAVLADLREEREPAPDGAAAPAAPAEPVPSPAPSPWAGLRADVTEELFGDGFVTPGGRDTIMRLIAPLGLSGSPSVLLLGAGLGGEAAALAEGSDTWVSGYEADPVLVAMAGRTIKRIGGDVARRTTIAPWDPAAPSLRRNFYHHALALDVIPGAAPQELLGALALAVKPGGQLVLVQTVREPTLDPRNPAFLAWARMEQRAPSLPLAGDITRTLARLGFHIHVEEDVSARHRHLVLRGWVRLLRAIDGAKPAPLHAAAIVREAERWLLRLRLIQDHHLRLVRWHAVRKESVV